MNSAYLNGKTSELEKSNLSVEPSSAPRTTKPTKKTSYSTGLAKKKTKKQMTS